MNSGVCAEPRVGRVGVGALGATAPLPLVRAPPRGFKDLLGVVPTHLERLEDFDIGRRGPRLILHYHQFGHSVVGLAVHFPTSSWLACQIASSNFFASKYTPKANFYNTRAAENMCAFSLFCCVYTPSGRGLERTQETQGSVVVGTLKHPH